VNRSRETDRERGERGCLKASSLGATWEQTVSLHAQPALTTLWLEPGLVITGRQGKRLKLRHPGQDANNAHRRGGLAVRKNQTGGASELVQLEKEGVNAHKEAFPHTQWELEFQSGLGGHSG